MTRSTQTAEHYTWGECCDGWHLLKSDSLSVIQERMPPNTSEAVHFHSQAQQLFYILSGEASFVVEGSSVTTKRMKACMYHPYNIIKSSI